MLAYIKAIVAALVAGLTSLGTALTDGSVSPSEWVSIALAFLLGLGIVAAAPKNATKTQTARIRIRNEDGFAEPGSLALGLVLGIVLGYLLFR